MSRTQVSLAESNRGASPNVTDIESACDAGRAVSTLTVGTLGEEYLISPHTVYDEGTVEESVAAMFSPWPILLHARINEPDADEVDGIAPRHMDPRRSQSFLLPAFFETQDSDDDVDDGDNTLRVINEYEDDWNNKKVEIFAPAPWAVSEDIPEDKAPTDIIPGIGDWEEFHQDLDKTRGDDDHGVWEIDSHGLDLVKEAALDAGYEWIDERGDEDIGVDETGVEYDVTTALDSVTEFVEEGDVVTIYYRQKNGNGIGSKSGEVVSVNTGEEDEFGYTPTQGITIERDDGYNNTLKRNTNDFTDDELGIFSRSQSPYMGQPTHVTVAVGSNEK